MLLLASLLSLTTVGMRAADLNETARTVLAQGEALYQNTQPICAQTSDEKLITDASQLDSNCPDQYEGSLAYLIDGNASTFFHSSWHNNYSAYSPHDLQVALPGNTNTAFWLKYTDRNANNDHVKTMAVYGSNDGGMTYSSCLVTFDKPTYSSGSTGELGFYTGTTPYTYYKFVVTDTYPSYRTFFHMAEFQLYPGDADPVYDIDQSYINALRDALDKLSSALQYGQATQALIDAVTQAMADINSHATVEYTVVMKGVPEGTTAFVYVDGTGYASGETFTHTPLTANDVTATPVEKSTCEISIYRKTITVTYRTEITAATCYINEVMPANIDQYLDPSWNYGAWVELYNDTPFEISLEGYYISNNPDSLKMQRIGVNVGDVAAHGHKVLWFEHYDADLYPSQIDMDLDVDGGTIYISDPTGRIVLQQDYPAAVRRCSYARQGDASDTWGWTETPTPGTSNEGISLAAEQLAKPVVDRRGCIFDDEVTVRVEIPAGATLCYTTNGSTPSLENGEQVEGAKSQPREASFTASQTTTYRWRLFQDGYLPSDVVTCTYLKKEYDYTLPVVSVVTQNENIYSTEYGLFAQGPNGLTGKGQTAKCNWNCDWDRPVSMEYFEEDSTEVTFAQEVAMTPSGGWSRAWTPHPFKFKAQKVYGLKSMDYPFFDENRPYQKCKSFKFRNGGNDNTNRFKDAGLQSVIIRSGLNIDCQDYRPAFAYINGKLHAVMNMREPNNHHYAYAHWGYDNDIIDQWAMDPAIGQVQKEGNSDSWDRLMALSVDASDPVVYNQIRNNYLDIDEFINYTAAEMYLGSSDWINNRNNVKAYRPRVEDGKFRFVMFDIDAAFSNSDQFSSIHGNGYDYSKLWRNMLANEEFCKQFVDAFSIVVGAVFDPDRTKTIINELATYAATGQTQTGSSPWGSANSIISSVSASRQTKVHSAMSNYSLLSAYCTLPVTAQISSDLPEARILLDGQPIVTNNLKGTIYAPVTLQAMAPAGYTFSGWYGSGGTSQNELVAKGSKWSYYDQGSLDGSRWMENGYNLGAWKSGNAPLGYAISDKNNSRGINTFIDYGGNTKAKYPTYYFRTSINLQEKGADDIYTLNYVSDDGFVIYINGEEGGRYLMPDGTPTFNTYATTNAPGNPQEGTLTIDASLFHKGVNVIAVEVHNNSATSTDIHWDAQLLRQAEMQGDLVSIDSIYHITDKGSIQLQAHFVETLEEEEADGPATAPVCINEVSAGNSIFVNYDYYKKDDWIELYNTTDAPIDVAGMYLTDNLAQPQKFQIPANDQLQTIIPAHGHLIVWASKRNMDAGTIHANFKLGNNDGEVVMLTSADGTWTDTLRYDAHSEKESVGRYPDGGDAVYRMTLPTISRSNTLTTYSEYLYTYHYTPYEEPEPVDTLIEWALDEGWNWVSHLLSREVAVDEMTAGTDAILGQDAQLVLSDEGWSGTLAALRAEQSYKVHATADTIITLLGPLFDPAGTIQLHQGWTWVGYPQLQQKTLSEALAGMDAAEGDAIVGQNGFALYQQGTWQGTLLTLEPLQGYLYRSDRLKTWYLGSNPDVQSSRNPELQKSPKPRFVQQPSTPWSVSAADYPNIMGVVCTVGDEEHQYALAAFDDEGRCRGVGRYVDGLIWMTVYGTSVETLTLKATDAATGLIYEVNETLTFTPDVVGTIQDPIVFTLGIPVDVAQLRSSNVVEQVGYYSLGGMYLGKHRQSLLPGIYVRKYTLRDGTIITKKISVER